MKTSPLAWFRSLFARKNGDDPRRSQRFFYPMPIEGVRLTEQQALELGAVWACMHIISVSIASCRVNVYEELRGGRRELRPDDPVAWLMNTRPNPDMTAVAFKEALFFQAVPFGNAYAEIVRDRAGRVAELWPLDTSDVQPRRDENWQLYYEVRSGSSGETYRLEQRNVFHLRGPGLSGLMGDNLVARAAKSLAVAAAQERYAGAFFGNGANPGGILEYPGTLSAERHAILADDFKKQRSGPENAHRPLILEEGMKWQGTAIEPAKSQLNEERQFSVEEVARWFNVPLHKIQHLLHATFSNIEHQSIEFVRDCLTPWATRFQQEGDFKFYPQVRGPWRYLAIDMTPLKEGDAKSRAEGNAILRQNGVISTNEWRQREGLNPREGKQFEALLVQSNMTTLELVVDPPEPPAPAALPPGSQAQPGVEEPDDTDEEGDDTEEADAPEAQALRVIFAISLNRYVSRMRNRRAQLAASSKLTPEQVAEQLAEERRRQEAVLLIELEPAAPLVERVLGRGLRLDDLARVLDLVDRESTPAEAVQALLPCDLS